MKLSDKECIFAPWATDVKSLDKVDFLFGHFNFTGGKLFQATHTNGDCQITDLTNVAPLVFSGHFHIRKEYPTKKGKLVTVGSALELTWGDINNKKGFYVLDLVNSQYEFVENTVSPKHVNVFWSDAQKNGLNEKEIKNNFEEFLNDDKFTFDSIISMLDDINKLNPIIPCTKNITYNAFEGMIEKLENTSTDVKQMESGSILEYLHMFVDTMPLEIFDNIEKSELNDLIQSYLNEALNE